MNITEVLSRLQILTNTKFTQTELGKALGKTRSDINSKIKRGSELKISEIQQIENYILAHYNLNIDIINTKQTQKDNDFITIPVKGEFSSIATGVIVDNNSASYKISKELAADIGVNQQHAQMVLAQGDSMRPTIEDGDSLLVDTSKKQIYDGKIYCIEINKQLQTKRLQIIPPGKIKVISDNKEYDSFYIEKDFDCNIIGEVRWWGRLAR